MARLFYNEQELLKRPIMPGMHDPTHLYYHFRPARPANLVVTRDPVSGECNLSAGTFGVLTEKPFTICLHISKHSFDTQRNLTQVGAECVVCLPGGDTVDETWWTALPAPRGIFEADIANFTLLPSQVVSVPGIVECPVNLECVVEYAKDWFTHWAIFLRVVGASLDERARLDDRLTMIRDFPTYEVDDQTNNFHGAIERLGVNGELLTCPGFPVGPKHGSVVKAARAGEEEKPFWPSTWLSDLVEARLISGEESSALKGWLRAWNQERMNGLDSEHSNARLRLTRAFELIAWEEWDALHAFIREENSTMQVVR